MDAPWSDPQHVLDVVDRLLAAPMPELLARFSGEAARLVPHHAAAMQTGDCPRTSLRVTGDPAITRAVTSTELQRLADRAEPGRPVVTTGVLGGTERSLVLFGTAPPVGRGTMLALVPVAAEPPADALALAARLWRIVSTDAGQRALEPRPEALASNLAAATARVQTTTDLGQTHATTLTTLLAVLRSGRLSDAAARRTAVDLAAGALVDLKTLVDRDQARAVEPAAAAFAVLRAQLTDLVRHVEADVDLVGPDGPHAEASLAQDIAHTARTLTRGLVLDALSRPATTRLRASWRLDGPVLRITVRDDNPDTAGPGAARGLTDRLTAVGGHWEVDAVPGWGTTAVAVLPLGVVEPPELRPLDRLNPREIEVLSGITRGLRNRQIAEELRLSEHTVKFHVRNLLDKLAVSSRGEAAALARDLRLDPVGRTA